MKYTWMIFILLMVSMTVFAEGPIYNFNFSNGEMITPENNDEAVVTVPLGKVTTVMKNKDYYRFALEIGAGRNSVGTPYKLYIAEEADLIFTDTSKSRIVLSYVLSRKLQLRFGYQEFYRATDDVGEFYIQGDGGLIGIQYREKLGKKFDFLLGFDFGYMTSKDPEERTIDFMERIEWVVRLGPQLNLGRFYINALIDISYTRTNTNINYNYGANWDKQGALATGLNLNLGFMI